MSVLPTNPAYGDLSSATPEPERGAPRAVSPRRRRRHPSHGARVIALVTSVGATLGVGAAMAYADGATASPVSAATGAIGTSVSTPSLAAAAATGASATTYADGTYTGAPEWTKWGNYQVQVVVQGGKIVALNETQAPTDPRSVNINNRAQPVLESEAIAAQSSTINAVSGATYTSESYKASLQSALDLAAQAAKSPLPVAG